TVTTKRPMYVTVRALNRKGETIDVTGEGLLARAFCHELDHLDGKLMIDRDVPTPNDKKKR
ncbi:MAG: peptide deformylase, partial [Clostridia bacterium]|nr:peptide deformylase [Clostridia bacterium]